MKRYLYLSMQNRVVRIAICLASFVYAQQLSAASSGTAFAVTDDGYFVTNNHVVSSGPNTIIRDPDGNVWNAEIVRRDVANDLALLKVESKAQRGLVIASSSGVEKGESVFAIGYPRVQLQGYESKLTDGLISSLSGIKGEPNTYQISVPVQPGNSGGPLFNRTGQVVGIVVAKLSIRATIDTGTLPENVNYAIKSNYLIEFLKTEPSVARKLKQGRPLHGSLPNIVKAVEPSVVIVFNAAPGEKLPYAPSPPIGKIGGPNGKAREAPPVGKIEIM